MRGAECSTDHRLLRSTMTLNVSPPERRSAAASGWINTASLVLDTVQAKYEAASQAYIADVHVNQEAEEDLDNRWDSICSKIRNAAEGTIGFQQRNHRDWFDENRTDIQQLLSKKNKAHDAHMRDPTNGAKKQDWIGKRREAQAKLRQIENSWWVTRAVEIQDFADRTDMHSFYESIKKVAGPTNRASMPVRADDGRLLGDYHAILDR